MPDIKDLKFAESDFTGQDIASLPDTPSANGISAAELKARFDNIGKAMLALGRFNALVDALQSTEQGDTGAKNIKMTTKAGVPTDVQTNLLALADEIASGGYGDMLKSIYDTTNSGSVDDADRLGGQEPAYYVPESGSGSNGAYTKFPDGTLICTKSISVNDVAVQNITTGFFRTNVTVNGGAFAHAFVSTPVISVHPTAASNSSWAMSVSASSTQVGNFHIAVHTASQITTYTGTLMIMAIGRWK